MTQTMSESEKTLRQEALTKIAEMDKNLKEKIKEKEWQEEMEHLGNQVYRQSFMHLGQL
jgi:hypothetical protein